MLSVAKSEAVSLPICELVSALTKLDERELA